MRTNSPPQRTTLVETIISTHDNVSKAFTRNISPPKDVISHCPSKIRAEIDRKFLHLLSSEKADLADLNALALNIFQNCKRTNRLKNTDNA